MFPVQDVPVADAKPEDIQDLLGGALFRALYKWMEETGPVYLLPTGARLWLQLCGIKLSCCGCLGCSPTAGSACPLTIRGHQGGYTAV